MNEMVKEWLAKAHGDFRTAERELAATWEPNYDAVCFHAQQCIEKMFKAILLLHGITPTRTHDLIALYLEAVKIFPELHCNEDNLMFLTRAAVDFRYPGESADLSEAAESFAICKEIMLDLKTLFHF